MYNNNMDSQGYNISIDSIVRENKIYRFASELQYCENEKRKDMIRKILKKIHNDTNDKSEKAREEITKICSKINENQMKKKWFRLFDEQKEEQIKKYYEENKDKQEEQKKILEMLKNNILENKFVDYDEKNGKIINIELKKEKKVKTQSKSKTKKEESESDSD